MREKSVNSFAGKPGSTKNLRVKILAGSQPYEGEFALAVRRQHLDHLQLEHARRRFGYLEHGIALGSLLGRELRDMKNAGAGHLADFVFGEHRVLFRVLPFEPGVYLHAEFYDGINVGGRTNVAAFVCVGLGHRFFPLF